MSYVGRDRRQSGPDLLDGGPLADLIAAYRERPPPPRVLPGRVGPFWEIPFGALPFPVRA